MITVSYHQSTHTTIIHIITGHRWDGHRFICPMHCFQNSWISRSFHLFCICLFICHLSLSFVFVFCVCLLYLSFVFVICICLLYLSFVFVLSFVLVCYKQFIHRSSAWAASYHQPWPWTQSYREVPTSFLVVVRYKCFRTFLSYISILQRSLLSFEMFKKIYFYLTKWSLYLTFFIFLKHQLRMK